MAAQRRAEDRAEADRVASTQDILQSDTQAIIRQFGRLSAAAGDGLIPAPQFLPLSFPSLVSQGSTGTARTPKPQAQNTFGGVGNARLREFDVDMQRGLLAR